MSDKLSKSEIVKRIFEVIKSNDLAISKKDIKISVTGRHIRINMVNIIFEDHFAKLETLININFGVKNLNAGDLSADYGNWTTSLNGYDFVWFKIDNDAKPVADFIKLVETKFKHILPECRVFLWPKGGESGNAVSGVRGIYQLARHCFNNENLMKSLLNEYYYDSKNNCLRLYH